MYNLLCRNDDDFRENVWAGVRCVIFIFLVISVLAFPNGPFTRPHPAVWRMVFGLSVLYLIALQVFSSHIWWCNYPFNNETFVFQFFLFQNYQTVRNILIWTDPSLENFHIDMDKVRMFRCIIFSFLIFNWYEIGVWCKLLWYIIWKNLGPCGCVCCFSFFWMDHESLTRPSLRNFMDNKCDVGNHRGIKITVGQHNYIIFKYIPINKSIVFADRLCSSSSEFRRVLVCTVLLPSLWIRNYMLSFFLF